MERVNITVPQLGEGIHQVRVISLLVKPSQQVNRDDPFAEVETDKATLVIESPVTGVVREILCQSGDTIEVGATFAWVDGVPGGHDAKAMDAAVSSIKTPADRVKAAPIVAQHPGVRNAVASPRQQALMRQGAGQTGAPAAARDESGGLLSQRQQLLGQRLRESHLATAVATIEMELDWTAIEANRRRFDTARMPTGMELVAWAAVRAMREHPSFRIQHRIGSPATLSAQVDLGIAVALPEDQLTTARVANADQTGFFGFLTKLRSAVETAGTVTRSQAASLVITDLSIFGVIRSEPVVVSPSIATLSIGYPDWKPCRGDDGAIDWRRHARLVLAFDHCFVNGAGASHFLETLIDYAVNSVPVDAEDAPADRQSTASGS
jgi:pyruvate/2-oxoglutarate dehydrogenase complex dihydrolipoamide acyltransferase (E2) component